MRKKNKYTTDPMAFPEFTSDQKPLIIDVANGQWTSYAQNNPPTPQDDALLGIFHAIGGINMAQPPGRYHFIVEGFGTDLITIRTERVE